MKFISPSERKCLQGGFSLVEVLIGLVLSGLLMSMVAMVLGQSVTNNEVVRSTAGLSSRMFTMRRVLHRDLQNISVGKTLETGDNGFSIFTSSNFLVDGGVEVKAEWDFSANMIRRSESNENLGYSSSFQFLRGLESWRLEFLDSRNNAWVGAAQVGSRAVSSASGLKALRLELVFDDGQKIMFVERVPYANQ
ncbi:prepilin-type N-terminal cleavage/methylation domain-containing protein [Maridesulfovibrio sp.]|uniref:PulJ/GspJ family protein n=1 Tax=Maridesulfovibrio sp. TaxID=2795000 RepID=UPI002A187708|nr:prepilin-type N-terminal cleavage/methylation domain-containing protein [Maridesulfovibrio sp.]